MDNSKQYPGNMPTGPSGRPPMRSPQGPRPPMGPAAGAMAMTPKEIMGILRRHLWMILIFTILGTILGGGAWFLCNRYVPKYTSVRAINVDPPIEEDPIPKTITGQQPNKDIYYQFRFTKASLVKQQNMLEELLRQDKIRATEWFRKQKDIDHAYKDLEDNLGASAPRDNNYILVSMSCGSATEAKTIVDEMVRIFLAQQRDLAQGGLKDELATLKTQRGEIDSKLKQIEGTLDSLRKGTDFARLNLGENQSFRDYMDERLADLEQRTSEFESDKSQLEVRVAQLKAKAESFDFDESVKEQVENDPVARQMRASIAVLEPELDRQLARFGEDHRTVQQTRAALQQMYDQYEKRKYEIGEILRQSQLLTANEAMATLTGQLDTTKRQLQDAKLEYKKIDNIRSDFALYEQQRVENRDRLQEMNTLIEKKTAQHDSPKLSKLSSPYAATKPREKSFPRKIVFFPGGFILGMLAGLGLAFLVEFMNDLLRTPSDVMRHLKVPLMGMICHTDDDEDIEGVDLYHVVRQAPYSIMSECYRQLRTNLKLSGSDGLSKKTLLVTSTQGGDGKTTVAVNLASTLLAEDRRVLLIDGNFRRPSANRLFPQSQPNGTPVDASALGLSNYLMGQCDGPHQVIRESGIAGLYVIDCGPLPANPAELLSGKNMQNLMEYAKSNFDYVIIDGPAALVSDSKTLASQVDGTIIVFNAAKTHRGEALRILREMREIHAEILGTVLLGVKSRKGGYFRENYRSYQDYQRVQVEQLV